MQYALENAMILAQELHEKLADNEKRIEVLRGYL